MDTSLGIESLATELCDILATREQQQEFLENHVWRVPRKSLHMTAAVFQEHPKLLATLGTIEEVRFVLESEAEQIQQLISDGHYRFGSPNCYC
jgi:hypothetical protein